MSRSVVVLLFAMCLPLPTGAEEPASEPEGAKSVKSFASPVHAGCYLAAPDECRIHVDPFTANVASGENLVRFQLRANGSVIYDFSMDVSNPPEGVYTATSVGLDFAVVCGTTYRVAALTQDSGDPGLGVAGLTGTITCPSGTPPS